MAVIASAAAPLRRFPRARRLTGRLGLALGLMLLVAVGGTALRGSRAAVSPSEAESELSSAHAVLSDLHGQFFRPVEDAQVLQSAWTAALARVEKAGVATAGVQAPDLTHGHAQREFDRAYMALDRLAEPKLDPRVLGQAMLAGAAGSVHENHTYYLGPEHWNQRSETSTQYAGIGVTMSEQSGSFYFGEVYPGSPAAQGGLRSGDRLVAVNGVFAGDLTMNDLTQRIRGAPGTEVQIAVARDNGWLQVALTRQLIVRTAFSATVREDGVGLIQLTSFPPASAKLPDGKTVPEAFAASLSDFERQGVKAWVLDLRGNGGGYIDTMSAIAGYLLPAGSPYFVSHNKDGDQISNTSTTQQLPARPMSVIVDGGSASASEILAVALQESGRATVVGLKSAGVANAANLDALPDGGGLSVTTVQTLTPILRRPLDGQGVTPDVEIGPDSTYIPLGRDRQIDAAALAALLIQPTPRALKPAAASDAHGH